MKALRLSPSISITFGLVSLTIMMFLLLDTVAGIIPDADHQLREIREQVSTNLALQLGALLRNRHDDLLQETISNIQQRDDDILSLGIRLANGRLIAQSGYHDKYWVPQPDGKSTLDHVQIPVLLHQKIWGYIEISFRPRRYSSIGEWLRQPGVSLPLTILLFGSLLYYLYLRRVLNHLDPTQVIPERVHAALDTLAEGVMIVDRHDNILLVNENFKHLHPNAADAALGKKTTRLKWLHEPMKTQWGITPWHAALRQQRTVHRSGMKIPQPDGDSRIVSINASPVRNGQGQIEGALITFSDTTERERANQRLRQALARLQESQSRIEAQNRELTRLANHDQLTGILNRRAFFEQAGKQLQLCIQTNMPLTCIMCDIDHFKSINDNYGHPIGDSAIKVVTALLSRAIRQNDVLGRYGGEEFCVVLPGISAQQGMQIAERMRASIEKHAGKGVRSIDGLHITSSFGVSVLTDPGQTLAELIDQADRALYASKENGRNRVSLYTPETEKSRSGDP